MVLAKEKDINIFEFFPRSYILKEPDLDQEEEFEMDFNRTYFLVSQFSSSLILDSSSHRHR